MKKFFISILFILGITLFTNKTYAQTVMEEFVGLFDCENDNYEYLDKTACPSCGYCFSGFGGNCPICEDEDEEEQENPNYATCYCCGEYYYKGGGGKHYCEKECRICKICLRWFESPEDHRHR